MAAPAPYIRPAVEESDDEEEVLVEEAAGEKLSLFSKVPEMKALHLDGFAREGSLLTVMGAAPQLASYQWYRLPSQGGRVPIKGAIGPSYRVVDLDVGHSLEAEVSQGGKTDTVRSGPVQQAPIALENVVVEGGSYYTSPLHVRSTNPPANAAKPRVQWFRSDPSTNYFEPIDTATTVTYSPTCDDLHTNLRVEYTPSYTDGKAGTTSVANVDTKYLTIDPKVGDPVEKAVSDKHAEFTLVCKEIGKPSEPRTVTLHEKFLTIKKGAKIKAKTKYYADVLCTLSKYSDTEFDLTWQGKQFTFECENRLHRDEVVLTIRSFVSLRVIMKSKSGIKRVQSLSELRESERAGER